MQVKKQQLELDIELWTGSKLGEESFKAVYCHPTYLTYTQTTSCEIPGWMKHKLESRDSEGQESLECCSLWGCKESDMTEQLSLSLSKIFSQFVVIHTVNGFIIGHEAEVDVFLEFLCFLCDPMNVGNLISGSSAFSKSSLSTWKFSVHILPEPSLKDFEYNLTSM